MLNSRLAEERNIANPVEETIDFPNYRSLLNNIIVCAFINNECALTECKLLFCREDDLYTVLKAYTLKNSLPLIPLEKMRAVLTSIGFYPEERNNGILVYPFITYDKTWANLLFVEEEINPEYEIQLTLYNNNLVCE